MNDRSAGERVRALLLQLVLIAMVVVVGITVIDILSGTVEPMAGEAPAES